MTRDTPVFDHTVYGCHVILLQTGIHQGTIHNLYLVSMSLGTERMFPICLALTHGTPVKLTGPSQQENCHNPSQTEIRDVPLVMPSWQLHLEPIRQHDLVFILPRPNPSFCFEEGLAYVSCMQCRHDAWSCALFAVCVGVQ